MENLRKLYDTMFQNGTLVKSINGLNFFILDNLLIDSLRHFIFAWLYMNHDDNITYVYVLSLTMLSL